MKTILDYIHEGFMKQAENGEKVFHVFGEKDGVQFCEGATTYQKCQERKKQLESTKGYTKIGITVGTF